MQPCVRQVWYVAPVAPVAPVADVADFVEGRVRLVQVPALGVGARVFHKHVADATEVWVIWGPPGCMRRHHRRNRTTRRRRIGGDDCRRTRSVTEVVQWCAGAISHGEGAGYASWSIRPTMTAARITPAIPLSVENAPWKSSPESSRLVERSFGYTGRPQRVRTAHDAMNDPR
jgi:hypothetical protein